MKKAYILLFCLAIVFSQPSSLFAQIKPKTEISKAKTIPGKVEFTLTSEKPFIFGSNRYILYIGNKAFYLNKQWKEEGKGKMVFYIPTQDFNSLPEGVAVYLTYGTIFRSEDEQIREEISKVNNRCWPLGKFSKTILSK
jgi:hypothetical protein